MRQEAEAKATQPSQTDWYLMQIAQKLYEVEEILVGSGYFPAPSGKRDVAAFRLRPEKPAEQRAAAVVAPQDAEQATAYAKGKWAGLIRIARKEKRSGGK